MRNPLCRRLCAGLFCYTSSMPSRKSAAGEFTREELKIMRPYNTPRKIQDFIDTLEMNFEESCYSPREVLRSRCAQCLEGAILAAAMLRLAGWPPLLMDLRARADDEDHVIALFQIKGQWGAISKTNHGVLRYREPVYKTFRELAMSFFHEYFKNNGEKTLRSFSGPVDLSRFDRRKWMTTDEHLWDIYERLDAVHHYPILTRSQLAGLRLAAPIEREMGKIAEWKRPRKSKG